MEITRGVEAKREKCVEARKCHLDRGETKSLRGGNRKNEKVKHDKVGTNIADRSKGGET